jgi:2-haloacid dehalogenase
MYWSHWEESLPGEMPGMYDLVAQLKGNPSNHIYGLTNWSMETFPIARQRFKVLQLIDDYVVSGAEGFVKPDHRLFQILLDRFGLRAEECVFVDDNAANVASACEMGFNGIVFEGADNLRKKLN